MLLVVLEHDRGAMDEAAREALAFGRNLAGRMGAPLHAALIGADDADLVSEAGAFGAEAVYTVVGDVLGDFGPEAWGEAVAELVRRLEPGAVLAGGSERGNEVMAQAAARLDLPMVANCIEVQAVGGTGRGTGEWTMTRQQWGGSLAGGRPAGFREAPSDQRIARRGRRAGRGCRCARKSTRWISTSTSRCRAPWSKTGLCSKPGSPCRPPRWWSEAAGVWARQRRSPPWRSWRPCWGAGWVAAGRLQTTAGGPTPTRWARPAPASPPRSTSPRAYPGPSSTGWGPRPASTSWPSTSTPRPTWCPKADWAVIADLHEVIPALIEEIKRRRAS